MAPASSSRARRPRRSGPRRRPRAASAASSSRRGCSSRLGPPDHSVSSLRASRSWRGSPNTIAPSRPLPTGSASTQAAAGFSYQRRRGASAGAASRCVAASRNTRVQAQRSMQRRVYQARPPQPALAERGDKMPPVLMKDPAATPPAAAAARLACERFGVEGEAVPLPGELDDNFRLDARDGRRFVLKLMHAGRDAGFVALQTEALRHLAREAPELELPRVVPTLEGEAFARVGEGPGAARLAFLLTWVNGVPLAEARPRTAELHESLGRLLGRMSRGLAGFDHPAAHRELQWDLARAGWIREALPAIADGARRELARALPRAVRAERRAGPAAPAPCRDPRGRQRLERARGRAARRAALRGQRHRLRRHAPRSAGRRAGGRRGVRAARAGGRAGRRDGRRPRVPRERSR